MIKATKIHEHHMTTTYFRDEECIDKYDEIEKSWQLDKRTHMSFKQIAKHSEGMPGEHFK